MARRRASLSFSSAPFFTFAGLGEEERRQFANMRIGELLGGRVAERREALIVEDLQRCSMSGSEVLAAIGATSHAGFPLVAEGELVGTIAFVSRRLTHFRDGEIRTVQTVCHQVAARLERPALQVIRASVPSGSPMPMAPLQNPICRPCQPEDGAVH